MHPHAPDVSTEPVALTRTFRSSRTFSPTYSLLGRWIRHLTGDRLRGEALFILTITSLVLGVLMAHYLGWALLQPAMNAGNPDTWQLWFWFAQIGSVALLFLIGGVGWRPSVEATIDTTRGILMVEQGKSSVKVHVDEIEDASIVSPRLYHMHYRHHAATRPFISRPGREVIILRTGDGPIALSLDEADAGTLVDLVRQREEVMVESAAAS